LYQAEDLLFAIPVAHQAAQTGALLIKEVDSRRREAPLIPPPYLPTNSDKAGRSLIGPQTTTVLCCPVKDGTDAIFGRRESCQVKVQYSSPVGKRKTALLLNQLY
jgi:hypothetical protein